MSVQSSILEGLSLIRESRDNTIGSKVKISFRDSNGNALSIYNLIISKNKYGFSNKELDNVIYDAERTPQGLCDALNREAKDGWLLNYHWKVIGRGQSSESGFTIKGEDANHNKVMLSIKF